MRLVEKRGGGDPTEVYNHFNKTLNDYGKEFDEKIQNLNKQIQALQHQGVSPAELKDLEDKLDRALAEKANLADLKGLIDQNALNQAM